MTAITNREAETALKLAGEIIAKIGAAEAVRNAGLAADSDEGDKIAEAAELEIRLCRKMLGAIASTVAWAAATLEGIDAADVIVRMDRKRDDLHARENYGVTRGTHAAEAERDCAEWAADQAIAIVTGMKIALAQAVG